MNSVYEHVVNALRVPPPDTLLSHAYHNVRDSFFLGGAGLQAFVVTERTGWFWAGRATVAALVIEDWLDS